MTFNRLFAYAIMGYGFAALFLGSLFLKPAMFGPTIEAFFIVLALAIGVNNHVLAVLTSERTLPLVARN